MNPGILIIGGLAGLVVVSKTGLLSSGQPVLDASKRQQDSFWPSWMNVGSQPATGQGQNPTETAGAVAGAVAAVAHLGTSLVNYFGTNDGGSQDPYDSGLGSTGKLWTDDK